MLLRNVFRDNSAGGLQIIEAFITGASARRIGSLAPDDRVKAISRDLDVVYPGASKAILRSWSISWDHDPFALGDYPWYAPGELLSFEPILRRAEGRIFFAGEQASSLPGWMEGAVAAGNRAAQDALTLLHG